MALAADERAREEVPPVYQRADLETACRGRAHCARSRHFPISPPLRWSDVDEAAGIIRIETSKSGEPRTLPYSVLPELAELIAHRREVTDAVQRKRGMKVNSVFHRNGEPILHFRRSWTTACIAAGLGQVIRWADVLDDAGQLVKRGRLVRKVAHRLPHDYRRSAARNLSRAGVPEGVIMKLCG